MKFSSKLHPEQNLLVCRLRNALIAHKQEWLMKKMGTHPHFATILGALHVEIEEQIQYSAEERCKFLQSLKPILEKRFCQKLFIK